MATHRNRIVSSHQVNDLVVYFIFSMAKQKGILKFIGKIGDTVFYYDKLRGYLARKVTSVNAERIRTDPAFVRVRENNAEFANCAWMVKLLRAAFKPLFAGIADTRMTSRLTSTATTLMRSDVTHAAGLRKPEHGEVQLLQGFDFNKDVSLRKYLLADHHVDFNQQEKTCTITLTPTAGKKMVKAPKGATHVRITTGIAAINFKTGNYILDTIRTAELPTRQITETPITITTSLTHGPYEGLFITLGVEFLQEVNGVYSPLQSREYNAMTVIHAEKILQSVEPATCLGSEYADDILLARGKGMVGAFDLGERSRRQRLAHRLNQRPLRQRIARSLEKQHRQGNRRQMICTTRVRLLGWMQRKTIEYNSA
jgi:hypothetical protein